MKLSRVLSSLVLVAAIAMPSIGAFPLVAEALTKSERSAQVKSVRAQQRAELTAYRRSLKSSLDLRRADNKTEADALKRVHRDEIAQATANKRTVEEKKAIRAANSAELKSLRNLHKTEVAQQREQNRVLIESFKARQARDIEPIKNQPVTR